jgi:WD40 repeat protein
MAAPPDDDAFGATMAPPVSGADATMAAPTKPPAGIDATMAAPTKPPAGIDATMAAPTKPPAGADETMAAPSGGGGTLASVSDLQRVRIRSNAPPTDDLTTLGPVDPHAYVRGATLAMGGMGRIVLARDRRLGRQIALKEIRGGDSGFRARFQREAMLTARLQHPNIITIHEAGVWPDGEPFFAMRLVAGRSLDKVCAEKTTLPERLSLLPAVIAVCDALAYAHKERVIHRDLKPANVLVGDFGETVVIDWGLAKDLASSEPAQDAQDSLAPYRESANGGETVVGSVLGTPAYMPPEQARGETVDERADVYALGALLYHVLSGRPPVEGATLEDVIQSVITKRVEPVRVRDARVPRELDTIISKAMEPEPAARYPTAMELAEDLRRFQTGQLVGAHRYTTWQLVTRWVARRKTPLAVAAIALVVLAVGGVISVQRTRHERDIATASAHALLVEEGRRESLDHHPLRALALFADAMRTGAASDDLRFLVARVAPYTEPVVQRFAVPDAHITSARFSADEKSVLTASTDGDVRTWDLASGTATRTTDAHGRGGKIALGPSDALVVTLRDAPGPGDNLVATVGSGSDALDTQVVAYDEAGTRAWRVGHTVTVDRPAGTHASFTSEWQGDIKGARAHGADLLVVTNAEIALLHDDGAAITQVRSAEITVPDLEGALVSANLDRVALVTFGGLQFMGADGTQEDSTRSSDHSPLVLSDDGRLFAQMGDSQGNAGLVIAPWGGFDGQVGVPIPGCDLPTAFAFSADDKSLLVACPNTSMLVFDTRKHVLRASLFAEVDVLSVAMNRDGSRVLATLRDGTAAVWDVTHAGVRPDVGTSVVNAQFDADERAVVYSQGTVFREGSAAPFDRHGKDPAISFTPDGRYVAVENEPKVEVRALDQTAAAPTPFAMPEPAERIAVAPGGKRVYEWTATANKILVVEGDKVTATWPAAASIDEMYLFGDPAIPPQHADAFAVSPDGTHLLASVAGHETWIIDTSTGAPAKLVVPGISLARWSPAGDRVVTGTDNGIVQLWSTAGTALRSFQHADGVRDAGFSADGTQLFTACDDGSVRQWNAETGELVRTTQISNSAVLYLAVDPRGDRFAAGTLGGEVAIWSGRTGEKLASYNVDATAVAGVMNTVRGIAFSRSGARFAVATFNGAQLWDTSLDAHSADELGAIARQFVPWTVVDGRLEPRALR